MFRSFVFGLLGLVAWACVTTDQCRVASAQSVEGWPPKEIKSSGKTWGVYMKQAKFENLAEKGMLVAEADSEEEAKRLADAYFKHPQNKFPHDLFGVEKRDDSKRGTNDGLRTLSLDMPGGRKLVVPLSNVDPKPIPTAKPPVVDLKGKVARGKLGQYAVTFEFREGNKLVISGEAVGEGEWGLAGDQLTMTTQTSVFLGAVDKEGKMKGKRVRRDGKELLEWEATVFNVIDGSTKESLDLVGTKWVIRANPRVSYTFNKDHSATYLNLAEPDPKLARSRYRWSQDGSQVKLSYDDRGTLNPPNLRGTVSGNAITLQYFAYDWTLHEEYKDQLLVLEKSRN